MDSLGDFMSDKMKRGIPLTKLGLVLLILLIFSLLGNIFLVEYWYNSEYPNGTWGYGQIVAVQNRDCDGSPCTNFIKAKGGDKLYFEYHSKYLKPEMFKPYWDDGFNCYMMPCYTIQYHTEDRSFCVGSGTYKTTVIDGVTRSGSYAPFDNVTYVGGLVCNEKIYVNGEFVRWDNCSR